MLIVSEAVIRTPVRVCVRTHNPTLGRKLRRAVAGADGGSEVSSVGNKLASNVAAPHGVLPAMDEGSRGCTSSPVRGDISVLDWGV